MENYMKLDSMDTYYEQAVKRKMSPATMSRLVGGLILVITAIVVSIVLMVTIADWLFPIVLTMLGLGGYLIYYLIKHSRVEYEYTFVVGELRIAKIKGKSKRRNITYFDVKNIDDMGRFIDPKTGKRVIDPSKYPEFLHAAVDDNNLDTYYFIIHDKIRKRPAVLLMTPNERTLELIRPYLSVELKKKFLKMQREEALISEKKEAAKSTTVSDTPADEKAADTEKSSETTKDNTAPSAKEKEPTTDNSGKGKSKKGGK